MAGVVSPPRETQSGTGPPRDIAGPICIATEALMVLANILPILVSTCLYLFRRFPPFTTQCIQ